MSSKHLSLDHMWLRSSPKHRPPDRPPGTFLQSHAHLAKGRAALLLWLWAMHVSTKNRHAPAVYVLSRVPTRAGQDTFAFDYLTARPMGIAHKAVPMAFQTGISAVYT